MKLLIGLTIVFIILVSSNFINAFINEKEGLTMWRPNMDPKPEGSWKDSCSNVSWFKDNNDQTQCYLKAYCKRSPPSGNQNVQYSNMIIPASIIGKCGEKYKNVNGVLKLE